MLIVLGAALGLAALPVLTVGTETRAATASISGVVWNDLNLDGRRQPDEPVMPNIGLQLFGDIPSTIESSRTGNTNLALTGEDGSYSFLGLAPGSYRVQVGIAGQTFASTYPSRTLPGPDGPIDASVALGDHPYEALDFGLVRLPDLAAVSGIAWVDGVRSPRPEVRAFVNGIECGAFRSRAAGPDPTIFIGNLEQGPGFYQVFVAPDELFSGCGRAGDTVSFTINGHRANETAVYPPPPALTLTAGPAFAVYRGDIIVSGPVAAGDGVTAVIAGTDCGVQSSIFSPLRPHEVAVLPAGLRPGCGIEGALVEFFAGDVPVGTAHWTPGFHDFDFVGERPAGNGIVWPPDTGDAGLR
jgi:hypothetical protein